MAERPYVRCPSCGAGTPNVELLADGGIYCHPEKRLTGAAYKEVPPEPGWYLLPREPSKQQYWNGREKTGRPRPAEATTRPFPGMQRVVLDDAQSVVATGPELGNTRAGPPDGGTAIARKPKSSRTLTRELLGVVAAVIVFVVAVLVKNHFGPLNKICDTAIGQFAQAEGRGSLISCGLDTTIFEVSQIAFWGSFAVAVLGLVLVGARLIEGPSVRATTSSGRGQRSATSAAQRSSRPSVPDATPTRYRCAKCNAPNDVDSPDTACYQCGAALQP